MNEEEKKKEIDLYQIYDRIQPLINGNYRGYHIWTNCGSAEIASDGKSLEFTVYGYNDGGDGYEWTEYWQISNDGKIYAEGEVYDNVEHFEREM